MNLFKATLDTRHQTVKLLNNRMLELESELNKRGR